MFLKPHMGMNYESDLKEESNQNNGDTFVYVVFVVFVYMHL